MHPSKRNAIYGFKNAMAEGVSRRHLSAEAWVRTRIIPCGICDEQSGSGTGLFSSSSVSPLSVILLWLFTLIISWGTSNSPVTGRSSETHSRSIDMSKTTTKF
jgi:hypothetical protein